MDSHYCHAVLFPFMSKGHTIPLLHLARLLLRHGVSVTVFTTKANRPFVVNSLADTTVSIIDLSFPQNIPGIPSGVESTDKLPSISVFPLFAMATKLMQPEFERVLESLGHVNFMVSDGFLWWTIDSALKFGFPRLVFYGTCHFSSCMLKIAGESGLLGGPESADELITVTEFPWIKVTKNDIDHKYVDPAQTSLQSEFLMATRISTLKSYGTIFNSYYELEPKFAAYWKRKGEEAWTVGPLCLARQRLEDETIDKPIWIRWLDQKLEQGSPVLYVAFGSQAEISQEQFREIETGLEKSGVNFLWVTRNKELRLSEGFEERVKERGMIVREWVDQMEILMHNNVQGFLSHCGWNSVLESICAGVPILAMPMMADQPLNTRMVVEEIKVGLRVETCDGRVGGLVRWEESKKMVREFMEGKIGEEVRMKVKQYADMAHKAMEKETGSSWMALDTLISEVCNKYGTSEAYRGATTKRQYSTCTTTV